MPPSTGSALKIMGMADRLLAGDQGSAAFQEAVDTADADVAAVLALAGHLDPNVRLAVVLNLRC